MSESPLRILAVMGSSSQRSATRTVVEYTADRFRNAACAVDVLDFHKEPLPLFNPETSYQADSYPPLRKRVAEADVLLLATPDYHGSVSGCLKNFLDHFWKEYAGKLFATLVVSYDKGLTVTDQLRTIARQCYAWCLPYGVACVDQQDLKNGQIVSEAFRDRLEMMVQDTRIYGTLLAQQRRRDLDAQTPGFLARYRGP